MPRDPHVSLPIAEPIALIDATLLFLVQVLLAKHPDLYPTHETDAQHRPPPGVRAAHHILDAIREVHHAIASPLARIDPPVLTKTDPPPGAARTGPARRSLTASRREPTMNLSTTTEASSCWRAPT